MRALNLVRIATPSGHLAGRTALYAQNWERITSDRWILETILGYKLELTSKPQQVSRPATQVEEATAELISTEVEKLLSKGAIHPVSQESEGFYSRIFLVPKKNGQVRPVINLRPLNRSMAYRHFKMEGIQVVRELLQQGDWLTRIDLKDAYFSVPIHPDYRHLLRFLWKGQAYEFRCLPFGLSTAPRVFTKIMRAVGGYLRARGVRCVIYLDDILIMNTSAQKIREQTTLTVTLLEGLGFQVNQAKSQLEPLQVLEFLGFVIDSIKRELSLPKEKVNQIKKEALKLLNQDRVSARTLARLLGKMSAAILAVYPAPLHYRSLQNLKHRAMRAAGYDGSLRISSEARQDLLWWSENLEQWNGRRTVQTEPEVSIETDASNSGWGAFCQGESTGGCWDQEEAALHINVLELLAVWYALKAFLKVTQVSSVCILSDNTTVVAYVNKMGGTRSAQLTELAKKIWSWCMDRQLVIRAQHLPGKLNVTADFLSRHLRDRTDWILNPDIFDKINRHWGPLQIDLFASRFSAQLDQFFSWRADPEAAATDAFSQTWTESLGFAHPPWCLLARVLRKVQSDGATIVVIAPLWKTQAWFPGLLTMLVDCPILLPVGPETLFPSPNCDCPVGPQSQLQLVAWKVSGSSSKQEQFRREQSSSYYPHGETRLMPTITLPGRSGKNGAETDLSVPFLLMSNLS